MAGRRSIFEDVAEGAAPPPPVPPGLIARDSGPARRATRAWLVVLFVLVAAMVLVGGATRLTDSGLSITEWRPVTGTIPPLDAAAWEAEFARYRESPQARLMNPDMDLAGFKAIYWWEWAHRLLGRVIGLVWAAGFAVLALARRVPPGWGGRLWLVGLLGAAQGAIGWWMVSSGLVGAMTSVASWRLAVHLGLAFAILGLLAWFVLQLGRPEADLLRARRAREARAFGLATGLMHLGFVQILLGALVAGIDAGRAFPTWPGMNGRFFPADAFYVPDGAGGALPVWHAFLENPGLVQFLHRMAGYLLAVLAVVAWTRGRRSAHASVRLAFHAVLAMVVVQVALGIATVLSAAQIHAALTHQAGAIVLWVLILRARFLAQYPVAGSIRKGTA